MNDIVTRAEEQHQQITARYKSSCCNAEILWDSKRVNDSSPDGTSWYNTNIRICTNCKSELNENLNPINYGKKS